MAELRKHLPRLVDVERDRVTDHALHHLAVELASSRGAGSRALHKLLDERHAGALRRFADAADAEALAARWREALAGGDVAGAYWAAMTHPQMTEPLRRGVFGDVHMLSHLVGASNRADIRHLVELERHNRELRDKLEARQLRSAAADAEHHRIVARLQEQLARSALREPARDAGEGEPDLQALRRELQRKDDLLALHTQRREEAERAADALQGDVRRLGAELQRAREHASHLGVELDALEAHLHRAVAADSTQDAVPPLSGKHILYVGGRPSSNAAIRGVAARWGIGVTMHDGGIEDRKGLLSAALSRADLVLFPVDCVDHDSMAELKRHCTRHGLPYHPLRSAGVASFVATVQELDSSGRRQVRAPAAPASRFCLRHG